MGFKRVKPELTAAKQLLDRQAQHIEALEQELAWMTNERNKLHRIIQAARDGFSVMHEALYPERIWEMSPDWDEQTAES